MEDFECRCVKPPSKEKRVSNLYYFSCHVTFFSSKFLTCHPEYSFECTFSAKTKKKVSKWSILAKIMQHLEFINL